MAARRPSPPAECPVCGAPVPPRARACPACGADERSGWDGEATRYDGLDLPDEAFDDDEPDRARRQKHLAPTGVPPLTWLVAAAILLLLGILVFEGLL